jgi:hypothetical protein
MNQKPQVHLYAKVAQNAVSRYPMICLKTVPSKTSLTRQSWVDSCHDFERREDLSDSTKGEIKCIAFFKKGM